MDFNKAKVLMNSDGQPNGIVITPRAKLLYPSLFKATAMKGAPADKAKYQAALLFPKEADLKPLIELVNREVSANMSPEQLKVTKIKKPFLKTEEQLKIAAALDNAGSSAEAFPVMIRTGSSFLPIVRGPDAKTMIGADKEAEEVYMGRWCRAEISFYWWHFASTNGRGVSVNLNSIQLLQHDTPLQRVGGGTGGGAFDAVEMPEGETADSVFD